MRIGLFTDSYHPQVNGIVFVVDITKKHLEAMGHEVFIFCPAETVRLSKLAPEKNVIRFRSVKGAWFEDYNMSVYFPAREMLKVKKMNLDVIQFFTPSQIGLLGVYSAQKTGAVLIAQHSTDLAQFIHHYPAVVPAILLIGLGLPGTFMLKGKDIRELVKIYKPRAIITKWGQEAIESLLAMMYSKCDAVIVLSYKSEKQLASWRREYWYDLTVLPTGIDALKAPTESELTAFKKKYGIAETDEVVLYTGRLSVEKNLDILIPTIKKVLKKRPNTRLLLVGDWEYRPTLEAAALASGVGDRITFTGSLPREKLGVAYAAADIFIFPSLTDTQGLVLHEAAHAGLPFVIIDKDISEVVVEGENGLIANNSAKSLSECVTSLLEDDLLRARYGQRSQELASLYGEFSQTKKLEKIYKEALDKRKAELNK